MAFAWDDLQVVQHISGLVHPAPLLSGSAVDLLERPPEAHRAVAYRQLRRLRQAAALQVQQHFAPAPSGLAHAVLDREQVLFPPFVDPDDHQHAEPLRRPSQTAVDAVRPEVHPAIAAHVAPRPRPALLLPLPLQTVHHVRRQALGVGTDQLRKRIAHLASRDALQIEPRNRRVQRTTPPNVRRNLSRTKRRRRPVAAAYPGNPHR